MDGKYQNRYVVVPKNVLPLVRTKICCLSLEDHTRTPPQERQHIIQESQIDIYIVP